MAGKDVMIGGYHLSKNVAEIIAFFFIVLILKLSN